MSDWKLTAAIFAAAVVNLYAWFALPSGAPAPKPAPPALTPVVCIDPGHPTDYSSGRAVVNGLREVDVNWEVALKLKELLTEDYGVRVVITRSKRDQLMNNSERAEVSNRANAALFLRLHCDAGPSSGFTLYYPNRKGESKGTVGPTVGVIEGSRRAAFRIHAGMASVLEGELDDRGIKGESSTKVGRTQGALTGSIMSNAPTVTVEMVFLTDRYDAIFIGSERGQNVMARALANGVMNYLHYQSVGEGKS